MIKQNTKKLKNRNQKIKNNKIFEKQKPKQNFCKTETKKQKTKPNF